MDVAAGLQDSQWSRSGGRVLLPGVFSEGEGQLSRRCPAEV